MVKDKKWKILATHYDHVMIIEDDTEVDVDDGHAYPRRWVADDVRNHGDAKLIAAAPDLLKACKAALYRLREYEYVSMMPTIEHLRTAIDRAEGK